MPESPTREGYIFVGWYKDAALTKPWQTNEQVSADTKLYARWDKHVYNIEGTVINDATPFVKLPVHRCRSCREMCSLAAQL